MNRKTSVTEIMTSDIISLHPEDSLNIVEETFNAKSFHHIPIVDTNRRVVGMVSKSDLLQISAIRREFSEHDFKFIKIKDFMTRDVVVADRECTLEQMAGIFSQNRFHAVPVVDSDKIIGIVTTHDLINAVFDLEPALF